MHAVTLQSINEIQPEVWDHLWDGDYPFIQHAFLASLENTHCTCKQTGWTPKHLIILKSQQCQMEKNNVLAIFPLYIKNHSMGEYVFDWSWADAYQQHGFDYYPKLINAIPFTPATGPRLGLAKDLCKTDINNGLQLIQKTIHKLLTSIHGSSFHCLFPNKHSRQELSKLNYIERQGCQFHWFNQNYQGFDAYLQTFNSRKRKALKKERERVNQQNLKIQFRAAEDVSKEEWGDFYQLYQQTYLKKSGREGYLSHEFFLSITKAMPKKILLASAHSKKTDQTMIASALYFRDDKTLYGRYWGALEDIDGLHFELCYYQGIEYAIKNGLERFDPGAQGEHKIQRGFTPVLTSSYHLIMHPGFQVAIEDFVKSEKQHNLEYCINARNHLPFKEGETNLTHMGTLLD